MLETKMPEIPAGQLEELEKMVTEAVRKCVQLANKTDYNYHTVIRVMALALLSTSYESIKSIINEEKPAITDKYVNKLVVRCKHCKHCIGFPWTCELTNKRVAEEDYCSYAYPKD